MPTVPEAGRASAFESSPSLAHFDTKGWGELFQKELAAAVSYETDEALRHDLSELADTCAQLVGRITEPEHLARLLGSDDPLAVSLCEQALWASWFKQVGPDAAAGLHLAMCLVQDERTDEAIEQFDRIAERYPTFAEVYHQRGMTYHMREDHGRAMEDFHRALQLNPMHFSAMANLGHSYVELGGYDAARKWYLEALRLHPKLPGVRQMLRQLRLLAHPVSQGH